MHAWSSTLSSKFSIVHLNVCNYLFVAKEISIYCWHCVKMSIKEFQQKNMRCGGPLNILYIPGQQSPPVNSVSWDGVLSASAWFCCTSTWGRGPWWDHHLSAVRSSDPRDLQHRGWCLLRRGWLPEGAPLSQQREIIFFEILISGVDKLEIHVSLAKLFP